MPKSVKLISITDEQCKCNAVKLIDYLLMNAVKKLKNSRILTW